MRSIVLRSLLLGAALAAACSGENDPGSAPLQSAGEAGSPQESSNGGTSKGGNGQGGSAGGTPTAAGESNGGSFEPGEAGGPDGTGGGSLGGGGGAQAGGEAGSAGGVAAPDGPYLACPAVGEKFELLQGSGVFTDEQLALARAFHCDLNVAETGPLDFTVERFEVKTPTFEVLASPHRFFNYDMFTIRPDCGALGYLEPFPAEEYSGLFAQELAPGTYVRVSCEEDMLVEAVPPPEPPTNIDCAHAKPLPVSTKRFPDPPTAELDEPRVGDTQARFYTLSVPSDPDLPDATWNLTINTGYSFEGSGGASVKLHGLSTPIERSGYIDWLDGEREYFLSDMPAGDYCVDFSVAKGVKYSIYSTVSPYF